MAHSKGMGKSSSMAQLESGNQRFAATTGDFFNNRNVPVSKIPQITIYRKE
jgi:hypothetical protein